MATEIKNKKPSKTGNVAEQPGNRLSRDELLKMHAYWRACNYLAVGLGFFVYNLSLFRKSISVTK